MSDKRAEDITLHPNSWLKEMARLNPAVLNISCCSRAAFAVAFPMIVGFLTDTLMYTMWISLGAMFPSIGERDAPYSANVRKILISVPIGTSGFLLGYVDVLGLNWGWVVLMMAIISFTAAILSTYSAAISIGCLQFMVMAAVAIGNPELKHFAIFSLLLLVGSGFYLFLLYLEKWIRPHRLRRDQILQVLHALIAICQKRLNNEELEEPRLQFNIKYEALYNLMLQVRFHALGHNKIADDTAAVVEDLDILFAALLAEKDLNQVQLLQSHLENLAEAFLHDKAFDAQLPGDAAVCRAANDLTLALQGKAPSSMTADGKKAPSLPLRLLLQQLTPGRATMRSAAALSLCTAIAYSIHWVYPVSHWYWVPMTVAIVMKPELGSIFVRAVQRAAGTAVGVIVGGLLLFFVPVGPLFILFIAGITFLLPWFSQRNYALTAFSVTPLVLVLIDYISPGHQGLEYAGLRLVDTLMGCAIVLIFGYLLWPRRHFSELNQSMDGARHAISLYLDSVLRNRLQPELDHVSEARRTAYSQLVDMRSALQKSMAEPPPAGYEAAAWFPLVACAARLCDAITVYSASASAEPDPQEWAWLQQMPQAIEGLKTLPTVPDTALSRNTPEAILIASINKESTLRERLYERVQPPKRRLKLSDATLQSS